MHNDIKAPLYWVWLGEYCQTLEQQSHFGPHASCRRAYGELLTAMMVRFQAMHISTDEVMQEMARLSTELEDYSLLLDSQVREVMQAQRMSPEVVERLSHIAAFKYVTGHWLRYVRLAGEAEVEHYRELRELSIHMFDDLHRIYQCMDLLELDPTRYLAGLSRLRLAFIK